MAGRAAVKKEEVDMVCVFSFFSVSLHECVINGDRGAWDMPAVEWREWCRKTPTPLQALLPQSSTIRPRLKRKGLWEKQSISLKHKLNTIISEYQDTHIYILVYR